MVSLALHHSHPMPLKPENKTGWLGQNAPGVATLAFDLSEAHLWCRRAPLQPPLGPMLTLRSHLEESIVGWLGQNAPGVQRWPLTCRRLTCGVAALHHRHPMPLKPENKTGWLGQNAPGVQRWPLTCRRLTLWCRYAPPQPPLFRGRNVTTLRSPLSRNSDRRVAGAECPRGATQGLRTRISRLGVWVSLACLSCTVGLARNRTPSVVSIVRITRPLQGRPRHDRQPRHLVLSYPPRSGLAPRLLHRVGGPPARAGAIPPTRRDHLYIHLRRHLRRR